MQSFRLQLVLVFLFCGSFIPAQTFERQILSSADDAEEKYDGTNVTISSSDLELMYDSWNDQGLQTIGLRFDDIVIPANATILSAYIQFTADGDYSGDMTMTIQGESSADSPSFTDTYSNISDRPQTDANASWSSIPEWMDEQMGDGQRSPDLAAIVTEVITSNGWQSSDPITFIITGTGSEDERRRAFSFDESPTKAAILHIEYASNSEVDLALNPLFDPETVDYPDATYSIQVSISSFGLLTAEEYSLSYAVNGTTVATESGSTPIDNGETILFTFEQTSDLSALGTYDLTIELTIAGDEDLGNNTLSRSVTVIEEVEPLLFDQGSAWRYWDIGADPGANWNSTDSDDSEWQVGTGHFGFGEGDEETVLNEGIVSYYFRKRISVLEEELQSDIYLKMIHDDAAIVYVNGQEVLRTELMPLGPIGHFTSARQRINDNTQNEFFTYLIPSSYFVLGENMIAVSLRNVTASDEDLSFDAFIVDEFVYDQDGPYISYDGDNVIVEEVAANGLTSTTYQRTDGLELTCVLPHMAADFSFTLHPEIPIEPSVYSAKPTKFLAISDFDGHIEGLTMVLQGEGVIDADFNWTYDDGHLIISGDLFDRGDHITECMWLLYKLESEAAAAGGKLHLIIGNHEMFNLTDDWRYVEVKYFNNAHLMDKRMSELYGADTELGRWLRSKNIIEKIGGHAFLHGGISPEVAALGLTIDEINEYGRLKMNGTTCPNSECAIVNGSKGIYWYRGMVNEDLSQEEVDDILNGFEVGRVIVGHTKDYTIRSLYEDRVIAIDMYHVDNFEEGYMEALQFELGCFYLFHTDGSSQEYFLLNECDEISDNLFELNDSGGIQIYSDAESGVMNIMIPSSLLIDYEYSILDTLGNLIAQGRIKEELTKVDIGGYPTGEYILTLTASERVISGSFFLTK